MLSDHRDCSQQGWSMTVVTVSAEIFGNPREINASSNFVFGIHVHLYQESGHFSAGVVFE